MSRNPVAQQIDRHYRSGDVWIIEKGREAEARLLQEAMMEIDRLQARVIEQDEAIAAELAETKGLWDTSRENLDARIAEYASLIEDSQTEIKRIRNAAKALVTNIDKTSFGEDTQS